MTTDGSTLREAGVDGVAVKPTEASVPAAAGLPIETVTIDFEGRAHVPDADTLARVADRVDSVRVTVPVRADGFDPLGDDSWFDKLPAGVGLVLVAGHPAYLAESERARAAGPRLEAAVGRAADPWVGTEGVEEAALATGATQFLLLGPSTAAEIERLRSTGFAGDVAVYAPTVLTDDPAGVLDALGPYVRRRTGARAALEAATNGVRSVLLDACRDHALVGDVGTVARRVGRLREAGADHVIAYPARGLPDEWETG